MSEQHAELTPNPRDSWTIQELADAQQARPVSGPEELAADIWSSDDELDSFLADLRASRDSSLA